MATVRRMFETNLFGIMATVKEFTPLIIASKGKIVSVSSIGGLTALV